MRGRSLRPGVSLCFLAGGQFGMRTMDSAIEQLLNQRQISGAEAYKKAINKARFEELKNAG